MRGRSLKRARFDGSCGAGTIGASPIRVNSDGVTIAVAMSAPGARKIGRRQFLGRTGVLAGLAAGANAQRVALPGGSALVIVRDPADPMVNAAPPRWAVDLLRERCESRGLSVRYAARLEDVGPGERALVVGRSSPGLAHELTTRRVTLRPDPPESFTLAPESRGLRAGATDARGLVYALTELADRVATASAPWLALELAKPVFEQPKTRIRGVMRLFVSDVEDKGWFHDRDFWRRYLTMLVTHRFNRFNLAFGIGYDFARQLRDTYFYFPYPFLLAVPGYDVRASGLPDAERDRNLESLRFISDEAVARGLHFQLGLWTHAFEWKDSPNVNYTIEGLTQATHAGYCREALLRLLAALPNVGGVTIRSHGESGVPETDAGRDDFWKAIFGAVGSVGRSIEIDLHAKGIDQRIIDMALDTKMPVRVSPKFWAEHMGLPYLQSSIRQTELPTADRTGDALMAVSTGTRNHMRYSYGDLFVKDRRYGILHRVWPGTQRLLLWGDPQFAAELGRNFGAFGADGVEFMEPLSFKGRKGSGLPGGRDAYADPALRASGGDWNKYLYTYRLWGRLAYDPDASPDSWRRALRQDFGGAAEAVESGLARSSRILPLITTAHCPSAANNNYWPELYSNISLFDGTRRLWYSDTPLPRIFNNVSSLDPQLFASVDECAEALLEGRAVAKVSPPEVARQLDRWAQASTADLATAAQRIADRNDPAYRRVAIDCAIAAGTGRFFARKLRAAVLFALYERTGDSRARAGALDQYRQARDVWAALATGPASAYGRDITFGYDAQLRGHWQDRLPEIDRDIAAIEAREPRAGRAGVPATSLATAIATVLAPPEATPPKLEHTPPGSFRFGAPIALEARAAREVTAVRLWYRHLNQAETYRSLEMTRAGDRFRGPIDGDYAATPYPMQYYFEVRSAGAVALSPGFDSEFLRRPYFVTEPA
jgi:hypothetical protein